MILFTGTYRFLDQDLPTLLNIMRTPGGRVVPEELRTRILAQVQAGPHDPRYSDEHVVDGKPGFFVFGAHMAVQWEQVTRTMQLRVLQLSRRAHGPQALRNNPDGSPDSASAPRAQRQGQMVYYFQAVDRFKHPQSREQHMRALRFVNMSKSAGLHGMLGLFAGMRVRLTKKVLGPELVQEATGEVVDIVFHPEERFGDPASSSARPADSHECWARGWVRCDRLPMHVEVRWDGCTTDYTGLGKPGVWHLAPWEDAWQLPVDAVATIDHPGAPRPKMVKLNARTQNTIDVTRCQIPLTHEDDMTFQNAQGKTIQGPEKQPKGLVCDLYKPRNMHKDEYFQHVYMALGRARKLAWTLLRNFPHAADGEPDWSVFERGPPEYLCELMEILETRAKATLPRMLRSQRALGLPAWESIKPCVADPNAAGRFLYNPEDWGFPRRGRTLGAVAHTAGESTSSSALSLPKRRCVTISSGRPQVVAAAAAAASPPPPSPEAAAPQQAQPAASSGIRSCRGIGNR